MSASSVMWIVCGSVLLVSSVIPDFTIQSKPSKWLVFFNVTRISRSFRFQLISTVAIVFPSNLIPLSFTSLYSVSTGFNGVILLSCDFSIEDNGEPLSIIKLFGRLSTNAKRVKNFRPFFFIWRVKWTF